MKKKIFSKLFICVILFYFFNIYAYGQSMRYQSPKYNYTIEIPSAFVKTNPIGVHIDLKFAHKDGSLIYLNISDRVPEEYKITAHNYTKEFLQNSLNQTYHETIITKFKKILIGNNKAVIYYYTDFTVPLKYIIITFFKGKYCYMITGSGTSDNFDKHEHQFLKSLESIVFN
ncbi:MAG: hypothetical protein ACOYLE_12120 [Bacteroidales bacterium]